MAEGLGERRGSRLTSRTRTAPTLTRRQLNRALLQRQLLLSRVAMPAEAAIEHLVGVQAQAPRAPYVTLWSRLAGFEASELEQLLLSRRAVRALGLLRTTIHLVTAADALSMRPILQGVATRGFHSGSPFGRMLGEIDLDAVLAVGRAALDDGPLTVADLGKRLVQHWPDRDPVALAMAFRYLAPLVQTPPRGLWSKTGRTTMLPTDRWLGRPMATTTEPDGLVLRYLAAFGPASVADVAAWSWLTGVREVVDRLRPKLRVFRDEAGRELFDLEDAPLPDPDTPAPVRFLAEYDNVLLSHKDRTRIAAPDATIAYPAGDGARIGTFLVDGFVAGTWRISLASQEASMTVEPQVVLSDGFGEAVSEEAAALGRFISGHANVEVRFGS